jgi:hypothetical protein
MDEVKSLAALERRNVGEVVAELVRVGLDSRVHRHVPADADELATPEQWMQDWLALADKFMQDAPPGLTARDLLNEERNRLDRR